MDTHTHTNIISTFVMSVDTNTVIANEPLGVNRVLLCLEELKYTYKRSQQHYETTSTLRVQKATASTPGGATHAHTHIHAHTTLNM